MIRKINDKLFAIFQDWCRSQGWPQAPRELFPSRGYIAFIGEKPVIAGWLYRDPDSAYSMMEYVVANPDSSHEDRSICFHELAEHIFEEARASGAKLMHMAIARDKDETFGRRLEAEGFEATDRNVTLYLKAL